MELYPLLKLVHILSATFLFGTGLGTAFYMWRADRSGDIQTIANVARNVVLADWLFTTPAVIIQPLSGFWMMYLVGFPLSEPWIVTALLLYIVAGACWLPVVWLQLRMRDMAAAAIKENKTALPARYRRYMKIWLMLGWPAFLAVLMIFYLMVFKPRYW